MERTEGNWIRRMLRRRRARNLIFICGSLILLFVLYKVARVARGAPIREVVEAIGDLGVVPFFVAMAILPTFGFPVTPFYLLSGATFGIGVSLVGTTVSQAVSLVLAYWLTKNYLGGVIEWLVSRTRHRIPEISEENMVRFTVLVRITPGPPNFLKNFILVLARVPFVPYLVISLPITMGYAVGMIVFGDSLADGEPWQAVGGVVLLVVFLLGVRLAGNAVSRRRGG